MHGLHALIATAVGMLLATSMCDGMEPSRSTVSPDFLVANLDRTVSPGDDFFEYANGGWFKHNPMPATQTARGAAYLLEEQVDQALRAINVRAAATSAPEGSDDRKIGDFWATALDVDKARRLGVRPLKRELARIDAVANLQQALDVGFALQSLEVNVLFKLLVDQDKRDAAVVAIYVNQGGLGLPDRNFYLNTDAATVHIRNEYGKLIADVLTLLGEPKGRSAAHGVMAFESALARSSRTVGDMRDPVTNYNRMTPAEFTRDYTPTIGWVDRLATWNLRPDSIIVRQPEYFAALDRVLRQTPISVLKDYFRFHLVAAYAPYLSPSVDQASFQFFNRLLVGQLEPAPRWKRVLYSQNTSSYLPGFVGAASPIGMLVGRRFVSEHFPEPTRQRYLRLAEAIETAFRERIERLDWLSEPTKAKALEKLAAIGVKVGYPDSWPDYSDLVIGRNSYCENMMNVARWRFAHVLGSYGKPVDPSQWRMTPQTIDAYFSASNNEIFYPAAAFVLPGLADSEIDDAVAYAYVGAGIAHELTHGFDDQGRKYDSRGNVGDWWTTQEAAEFEKRAQVLVRQFDAYEPLAGLHINGKASLSENIADYGGLLIALDAFKQTDEYRQGRKVSGFSPLQRFFLAYAYSWMMEERPAQLRIHLLSETHSPPKWRVLGPLANIPDFYQAFDVQPGQAMWRPPEDRVSIW
jgi:putative endopeptidase